MKDGSTIYLCKWRDLAYDEATWEYEDEDIEGLKESIEEYQEHRMVMDPSYRGSSGGGSKKNKKKKKKANDEQVSL